MRCMLGALEESTDPTIMSNIEGMEKHCPGSLITTHQQVLLMGLGKMAEDAVLVVTHLSVLHEECAGYWHQHLPPTLVPILRENAKGMVRVVETLDADYERDRDRDERIQEKGEERVQKSVRYNLEDVEEV